MAKKWRTLWLALAPCVPASDTPSYSSSGSSWQHSVGMRWCWRLGSMQIMTLSTTATKSCLQWKTFRCPTKPGKTTPHWGLSRDGNKTTCFRNGICHDNMIPWRHSERWREKRKGQNQIMITFNYLQNSCLTWLLKDVSQSYVPCCQCHASSINQPNRCCIEHSRRLCTCTAVTNIMCDSFIMNSACM